MVNTMTSNVHENKGIMHKKDIYSEEKPKVGNFI